MKATNRVNENMLAILKNIIEVVPLEREINLIVYSLWVGNAMIHKTASWIQYWKVSPANRAH